MLEKDKKAYYNEMSDGGKNKFAPPRKEVCYDRSA